MKDFYFIIKIADRMKSFCLGNVLSDFSEMHGRIFTYAVLDIYTKRKDDKVVVPYFLSDAQYLRLRNFVIPCIKVIGEDKIEIFVTDSKYDIIYSSECVVVGSHGRVKYK